MPVGSSSARLSPPALISSGAHHYARQLRVSTHPAHCQLHHINSRSLLLHFGSLRFHAPTVHDQREGLGRRAVREGIRASMSLSVGKTREDSLCLVIRVRVPRLAAVCEAEGRPPAKGLDDILLLL